LDDVVPTLAQIHLLRTGASPLGFRNGRLACGDAVSAALGRLFCKSRLCFRSIYTDTVVRCVVSSAATALMLFPRYREATGEVGAPTSDAPWCISAVLLRLAEVLAALIFNVPFGVAYESTDTRKPQCSVSDRTLDCYRAGSESQYIALA